VTNRLLLIEYYLDERGMWNACEGKESYIGFWLGYLTKIPLEKSRCRWQDNIKLNY